MSHGMTAFTLVKSFHVDWKKRSQYTQCCQDNYLYIVMVGATVSRGLIYLKKKKIVGKVWFLICLVKQYTGPLRLCRHEI